MSDTPHTHQTHHDIIKRLKRSHGHLRTVIEMLEAGRPCIDIAQQLYAVERAISQAKKTLIQDHLDHCLDEAASAPAGDKKASLDGFKDIVKFL